MHLGPLASRAEENLSVCSFKPPGLWSLLGATEAAPRSQPHGPHGPQGPHAASGRTLGPPAGLWRHACILTCKCCVSRNTPGLTGPKRFHFGTVTEWDVFGTCLLLPLKLTVSLDALLTIVPTPGVVVRADRRPRTGQLLWAEGP